MNKKLKNKSNDITVFLSELNHGDKTAYNKLFPIVYQELKKRAKQQKNKWFNLDTLNTTALVNETYLKLAKSQHHDWQCRSHFLTAAAQAMRHILIDYAKTKSSKKRGGEYVQVDLSNVDNELHISCARADDLISLDSTLKKFANNNTRACKIVEYRIFAGMSLIEISSVLGVSVATVKRDWILAQAWLYREMQKNKA